MLSILIDNRETKIKAWLQDDANAETIKNYKIEFKNLNLGDIIVKYNDEIQYIFERKTIKDLASSIKDKRFPEQKARLLDSGAKICYIFEGFVDFSTSIKNQLTAGMSTDALHTAVISTTLGDDISSFITEDVEDTIRLLMKILRRMKDRPTRFFDSSKEEGYEREKNLLLKKKNEQLTPNNILIFMLSQIPSISTKIATCIHAKHKTMKEFIEELDKYETVDKKVNYLAELSYSVQNNKTRRVGQKASERIVRYLYGGI